jgi:agmatinase
MSLFEEELPFNFLGLKNQSPKKAKVWILPVPFEATVFNLGGTKEGPKAIIDASRNVELFDEDLKKDISKIGIFTLPSLFLTKNSPKEAVFQIQKSVEKIFRNKKFPVILGGEHTLALGVALALKKFFKNEFSILQFDAHCDLRDEFEGTKYHHATFARRIVEDLKIKICQVGIRAISKEEFDFINKTKKVRVFFKRNYHQREILNFLTEKVYLTIDLDVLDPSIMPAVGTPEPEGLFFENILDVVKAVAKEKEILGFDVVELSPIPGFFAPNYLAAKLISKILATIFYKEKT